MVKKNIIGLCLIFSVALAFGQVNLSNNSADSEYPAIAVNHRGEVMVVWSDNGSIFYRLYRDGSWSGTQNSYLRKDFAIISMLDTDTNGNFHISYSDGYSSSTRDIYYSMFNGKNWGSSQRVCDNGLNSAWNRIAVDGNNVYVIWFQEVGGGSEAEIALNSKPIGGTFYNSWHNVSQSRSETSIHPAFDVVNGKVFCCYMEGTESNWDITYAERRSGDWASSISIGWSHWPGLTVDEHLNVFTAFYAAGGRFYFREKVDGEWGNLENLATGTAMKGFGDIKTKNHVVVAVWSQSTGDRVSIFYCYKYLGGPWIEAEELDSGNEAYYPLVDLDNEGNAHFVWEDIGQRGQRDIYYKNVPLIQPDLPFIKTDTPALSFTANAGEVKSKVFRVKNGGNGSLTYSISSNRNWITVSPVSGFSEDEWDDIAVTVDSANLNEGNYFGTVTITSNAAVNSPKTVNVSLFVKSTPPNIRLNKTAIGFIAVDDEANPEFQTFSIKNGGDAKMSYVISSNRNWLYVSPKTGASTQEWDLIKVSVDISALDVGDYTGTIKITSKEAINSPQNITVTLKILLPPYPYPPVNLQFERRDFDGLFFKVYLNKLSWANNPKNNENYQIDRYVIYRKKTNEPDSAFKGYMAIDASAPQEYIDEFKNRAERDQYTYAVTTVDTLSRESKKSVFSTDLSRFPSIMIKKSSSGQEKKTSSPYPPSEK